ncbi:hypothetical protein EJB05_04265, partial [Eragrostis curvula]
MGIPSRHPEHEEEEEYDDAVFYEDIQAPKFVDLTAPDANRPTDDASWFCLRVMAARSPNVWLHKAISRKNQSSMLKCPHSAPPKPPRARFARLSAGTETAEKGAARPKLRTHRICALRASPTRIKAERVEPSSARKKALTTPRSKALRPRQDPFLSVKHQKQPVAAAERKGTVVKALFMSTPRKEAARTPAPAKAKEDVSEVCSRLKKLNLACREVPSRYMLATPKTAKKGEETAAAKSAKKGQESRTNGKKKILGRSVKCATAEADERDRIGCANSVAVENSLAEIASLNQESKAVLQEVRIEEVILRAGNSDDNKENLSSADQHYEGENTHLENNENIPVKVATMHNKLNPEQGKLKTTNPKPFRLRTDERRVLKDANPERKQPFAENNSMAVLKDANRGVKPMSKCPAAKGRDKPICSEKQKKQTTKIATAQPVEVKQTLNSIRSKITKPAAMTKGKVVEKSQKVSRLASTTRTTKAASSGLMAPQRGKERKPPVKISRVQAAVA